MRAADLKLVRYTLALVWLVTGALSLGIYPQQQSLQLLERVGLRGDMALIALYGAAALDVALGWLTLAWPAPWLWKTQAALVIAYSLVIALYLPEFWLHPFGPLLKNLPILLLLWLLHQYAEKKS
ncbi:MAG: DoxX-like family protein [Gallionella sp.]|nr:DoxX-like family protein [Gallionella sp.]